MREDIIEEVISRTEAPVDARMNRSEARMDHIDAWINDHRTQSFFTLQCAKYTSLRNIEDSVLSRIKRFANLASETPPRETIDHFLRKYEAGVPREYLLSLRNFSVILQLIMFISPPKMQTCQILCGIHSHNETKRKETNTVPSCSLAEGSLLYGIFVCRLVGFTSHSRIYITEVAVFIAYCDVIKLVLPFLSV